MSRRHRHEEHANHEAWAIPYGDLMTLLLAFFVVMYAISSLNEGKYRVLADALSSAFGGAPRTITPIQLGRTQLRGSAFDRPSLLTPDAKTGPTSVSPVSSVHVRQLLDMPTFGRKGHAAATQAPAEAESMAAARARGERQLNSLGKRIQHALAELVRQKLVTVRRGRTYLEVEIQSDILFASGVAAPSPVATATVRKLAAVLRDEPNALRVEGYTDNQPIRTVQFPSNWELSSARAASVVHVLIDEGVSAGRMAVVGYGEHQPIADNATAGGRNSNRRVLLVILAAPQGADAVPDTGPTIAMEAVSENATPAATSAHASDTDVATIVFPSDPSHADGIGNGASPADSDTDNAPMVLSSARALPPPGAG
jgi:chemotaxis protein MotB